MNHDTPDHTPNTGDAVRRIRYRRKLTQEELAERAGLSEATVKSIETGKRQGRMPTLAKLARALGVSTTDLLIPAAGAPVVPEADPDGLLAVRRALTPPLGIDLTGDLEPEQPGPWVETLAYAERLYMDDRYDAVLQAVPVLIEEASILHRANPAEPRPLAQAYLYAANALTQLRQLDLANHALDKAMRVAYDTGDELLAAWAVGIQCWTLLLQRRFREVEQLAVQTAERIEPKMSDPASPQVATWGWLMMRASAAAIRDARTDDAETYMRQAKMAASRLDGEQLAASAGVGVWSPPPVRRFCETTVGFKSVENAILIGEHGKGLELAARVVPSRIPTVNNRNRHKLDLAAAHVASGNQADAIESLMDLRDAAPKWLSHQGYAREMIRELVEHRRRAYADQLGELADHVGLPV
ncbi:helix-turn-helix transcriptional regulator [Kribbella solani]|uniref:Transcriptional regulator with XRE-family HTH domain n=1 Tax=Kribbella solani TaxID=236067 RepID=A0A841E506_9ACTN|nr:helix-turn-helix transcriptional regulator [Kribbella solani]MBB5984010.1 transcriptional regulator with XRE-family HTH domain [Kribbella solani]